jgi:hypothetical protein
MSAHASGTVWKTSRAKGSALLVLLAIADVADDTGKNAWCGSKSLAPKTRLHVSCVFDPEAYAIGKPDNLSETAFPVGRPVTGQLVRIPANENRTSCPGNRSNRASKSDKSRRAYKEGSVSDPLVELKQGAAPPESPEKAGAAPLHTSENGTDETPNDNLGVITRLVHESFDILGFQSEDGDITERVKDRCAELAILYDTAVVWKAIGSARVQRQRRRSA